MTAHRRLLGALLATIALLLGLAGASAAESQTVQGTGGDLQKMSVSNGTDAVVAKVFGSNIECGVSRWVKVVMRDGDGTRYTAMGGCYPGGVWIKSLERGSTLVKCGGFTLKYNTAGGFWRFEVPRTCLTKLANKIKVEGELVAGSPTPGAAGPTAWLSRG